MSAVVEVDVCEHAPSDNPRFPDTCRKCGRPINPGGWARDPDFECEVTRRIAGSVGVNVEPLNAMAGHRASVAEVEYGRDFPNLDRNLEQEAAEELADARNYIVWRLEAIHRGLYDADEDLTLHLQQGLKYVALAFEEIRAANHE